MLSNDGLCLHAAVQYVLLFLVRFNNSDRFQISELHTLTLDAHYYALLLGTVRVSMTTDDCCCGGVLNAGICCSFSFSKLKKSLAIVSVLVGIR